MDKRTILAFLLIGLVLFFYGDFIKWLNPPRPVATGESLKSNSEANESTKSGPMHSEPAGLSPVEEDVATILNSMEEYAEQIAPTPTRLITVETDRFHAVITTDGGQLISYSLKPYKRYLPDHVELIPKTPGARPGYRFWTKDGPLETKNLKFAVEDNDEEGDFSFSVTGIRKDSLVLVSSLGGGRSLRLVYSFAGDKYQFLCNVEGIGTSDLWVRDYAEAVWQGGMNYTEADSAQDNTYSKAYTFFAGDALEEQKIESKPVTAGPSEGKVRWAAIRVKYFMVAMLPETSQGIGSWMESMPDSNFVGKYPPNRLGFGIRLPIERGSVATPVRLYAGPIDDDLLAAVEPSLKRMMNFGWAVIAPFSKLTLWGLKAMYKFIPNYGVCIIIFSILVKLLIWPLTHKQYSSMAAMQRVQPQMAELKEKYKGDPARLNKEMMKLYKEEKINPMGGCLPMLLQIPLLWALFTVFRSTIEFRHAPFAFWIHDLSLPDYIFTLPFAIPVYGAHFAVLPILMAVSTFYQTKLTMTDPNQKMMIYMMPIMMLLFFNGFPSGLNLYYTLLNVWTLVQQKITPMPRVTPKAS